MPEPSEPAVVMTGKPKMLAEMRDILAQRGIPAQIITPPGTNPNS